MYHFTQEQILAQMGEGSTLSGLPTPAWPIPQFSGKELDPSPEAMRVRMRAPKGPLAPVLSARLGTDDVFDSEFNEEADIPALRRVAAYSVPSLLGAEFEVESLQEIPVQVKALLARALPGIDWWVADNWSGPFMKYGFLHGSLPAPPNEATGEPMALELFGKAVNILEPGSPAWSAARKRWILSGGLDYFEPPRVLFPTKVQISVATYSNVRYPGHDVPFYG